jgi:hypothetical protein
VAFESHNVSARIDLAEMYFRLEEYSHAVSQLDEPSGKTG